MRRKGHTHRIHDFGPVTVSCLGAWFSDGSHRWPKIDLILRDRWTRSNGRGGHALIYRRVSLPLPYVRWATGYKHPSLAPLNRVLNRLYRRCFA